MGVLCTFEWAFPQEIMLCASNGDVWRALPLRSHCRYAILELFQEHNFLLCKDVL